MAVDLYVGSISRYLAGEWQTQIQRAFAEAGAVHRVQTLHADGWQPFGREVALDRAIAWRDQRLSESEQEDARLKGLVSSWQEELESPYEVERLWPEGIEAVTLALFYDDPKEMPSPVPDPLSSDRRVAAMQENFDLVVAAACLACDLWIPGEFGVPQTFDWPRFPDGSRATVGSLGFLKKLLAEIERLRWRDLPEEVHRYAELRTSVTLTKAKGLWPFRRKVEEEQESTFLLAVKTLDRMKAMTALALERNLPMIRDR